MAQPLEGSWTVRRTGGLLPPMAGLVRKEIAEVRGWTIAASVRLAFDVDGLRLRYRAPLVGLVDELTPAGEDAFEGAALLFGRRIGTFRMSRVRAD